MALGWFNRLKRSLLTSLPVVPIGRHVDGGHAVTPPGTPAKPLKLIRSHHFTRIAGNWRGACPYSNRCAGRRIPIQKRGSHVSQRVPPFSNRFSSRTLYRLSGSGRQYLCRAGQVHTACTKRARIL